MQKTQKPTSKNSLKHPIPKLLHIVENESLKCLQYDQYSKTGSPNDTKFTILRLVSTFSNKQQTQTPTSKNSLITPYGNSTPHIVKK